MWTRLRFLYRNLFHRHRADRDLAAELEAFAQARPRRGTGPEQWREEVRAARIGAGLESWARDLRHAARRLRQAPWLTLTCVSTFALGIGASTAVFSVANELLLRQPPLAQPQQLDYLRVWRHGVPGGSIRPQEVEELRQQTTAVFSGVTAVTLAQPGLSARGQAQTAFATYVDGNFFSLLGVHPALGRFFSAPPGVEDREPVLVLSYSYWQARFGGDPRVIGETAAVNGRALTIVGVGPKGFHGVSELFDTQAFMPLGLGPQPDDAQSFGTLPLARRRPEVDIATAQAAVNVVAARLAQAHPAAFHGLAIQVAPLGVGLINSSGVNPFGMVSALFLTLAGLVLLLAGANVMGLLLARTRARQREMAVRAALGGSRLRLARQVFLETLLLGLGGAAAGMALGVAASRALSALPPNIGFPLVLDFSFDWRVFLYGLAMALLVAVAAGVVPAWRAAGASPNEALRGGGGASQPQRLRSALVAAQVAGSLALLVVGGLFVRSLRQAQAANLGFDPGQVWNLSFDAAGAGYPAARGAQYFAQLLTRAQALPGVESASLAQSAPFATDSAFTSVRDAAASAPTPPPSAGYNAVSGGYFATLHIPILAGRRFLAGDQAASAPVVVVSQSLARRLWPGRDPVGQRLVRGDQPNHPLTVVGVAGNVVGDFTDPAQPFFYLPLAQNYSPQQTLEVRLASGVPAAAIAQSLARFDPRVPLAVQSMDQAIDGLNGLYLFHLGARCAAWLGLLGLALAIVGVYGVVAYTAAQRTRELGIRVALGARPRQVAAAVLRQALAIVAGGMTLGLLLAAAIGKLASAFLVGVSGLDPFIFGLASLLLGAVALAASLLPAWRATRADPLAALRCE